MAYPLIPLRDEKDILHRYMFLQDFLKESRKFGAQRRESERLAVERAVKNLAVNAGYSDEIRLILRMESQLTDDLPLTDKERKRVLKQQTLRAKNMLEQAMIDEIKFSTEEVQDMMHHQIMGELVRNLAWRWADESGFSFGFIDEEKLQELQAKNISTLVAAHPVTLFEHGALDKLKTEIVQNEIIQPFQQIYRDVFLQDEGNGAYKKLSSISGIKIIGRRGKRILAGRRWVYDGYDGMEKTFYAQNVIAALIARSDWMDEDFPILDYIEFYTRYDYERMEICQVPAIVLSEVLRDVQMMVSLTRMEGEC